MSRQAFWLLAEKFSKIFPVLTSSDLRATPPPQEKKSPTSVGLNVLPYLILSLSEISIGLHNLPFYSFFMNAQ